MTPQNQIAHFSCLVNMLLPLQMLQIRRGQERRE
jgi:hypothetical protein